MLLPVGCNDTHRPAGEQNQTVFVPDSLRTPTGDAKLDSLLQIAATAPQDTNLVKLYVNISQLYFYNDAEKAKEYAIKVGILSEALDWNKGRYFHAALFSNLLSREGLSDSALVILKQALAVTKQAKDEIWEANILNNTGNTYFAKQWYETSLKYYMEALLIYERWNDKNLQKSYAQLAQLYLRIHNVDKAIEYGQKAIALDCEDVFSLLVLSRGYSSNQQYEKAKIALEEALRLATIQNNAYMAGRIYSYMADDALLVFDLEQAEKYARQSMEIHRPFGRWTYIDNLIQLSKLELLKEHFNQSEAYAKEALQIAAEFEEPEHEKLCYTILAELAIAQRKYRENIRYGIELDLIENTIATETTIRAAEEMSAKYETEKKELEIERQQQIISRQNMHRSLLAGGVALCVIILALLWYMLRLRNRRNHALAERNDTLAEMNATKDKFFSIISHDLKNPALAQRDALLTLVKNARSWDTDTLADYHGELLKSADGQVELLYNLLNWAKIQTGRIAFAPETFLFSDLLPGIVLIRKMAENKDITLTVRMPENALITADGNILSTIIRNLLTNAVKFTPAGGTVTLDVSPCGRDIARNVSTGYIVSISDTGMGMPEEQIHNLFRPDNTFFRKGTGGEEGSGLGLIVCKELLEKHGSVLHVESEEGKGSRFWFELLNFHT